MRRLSGFALVVCGAGFACVALALALKSVMPGPKGSVSLAPGDRVDLDCGGAVLELADFRVPKYPSGMPRQYESDVRIDGRGAGESVSATISVNHPLRWNGFWIHQSSYDAAAEKYTVLTVFRDPWLRMAAAGGVLLLLGALLNCFASRPVPPVSRRRAVAGTVASAVVFAVPLFVILRAVLRAEPVPALQSPLMAPHVAAYAASYLILILAAFGLCRRLVPLGFLLMTLGLVLGALWGKICWGDFWQYDPKEMWSLATWLVCCAHFVCEGHPRAERTLLVLTALLAVLTATWVNFSSLFVGLHNYGAL